MTPASTQGLKSMLVDFEEEVGDSRLNVTILLAKLLEQDVVIYKIRHLVTTIEEQLDTIDLAFDWRDLVTPTDVLARLDANSLTASFEKVYQLIAGGSSIAPAIV